LSRELQIGQLLDNRFEVTALIERSGMAKIFKALDCQTRQMVVLKVPHAEFEGSPANSARFAREAAIIGKLDHPGILKVIPTHEKSRPYLVLDYIEGQTLSDILKSRSPLPVSDALQLASRLCDILDYMHRQDVIHRDLKPGNIMISDDGRPHILDFGIAKGPATEPFMLNWFSPKIGTPGYMSPEQVQGDRVDARTDLYSLGVVLYEVVTGMRPGPAGKRPLREINANVSEQVEEIILRALAPDPSERYGSAAAMKVDLDSPGNVRVTGTYRDPGKVRAWPKRLRMACVVFSIAATPFILFYLFFLMFQRQLAR
jgi:serine/threonine protein kinase